MLDPSPSTPDLSALDGLECPICAAQLLHSPTKSFESCWCRRCGSHLRLRADADPQQAGRLRLAVVGLR